MGMLQITDLKKSFGDKTVLDGLSLTVPEGSIFGFVGKINRLRLFRKQIKQFLTLITFWLWQCRLVGENQHATLVWLLDYCLELFILKLAQ